MKYLRNVMLALVAFVFVACGDSEQVKVAKEYLQKHIESNGGIKDVIITKEETKGDSVIIIAKGEFNNGGIGIYEITITKINDKYEVSECLRKG